MSVIKGQLVLMAKDCCQIGDMLLVEVLVVFPCHFSYILFVSSITPFLHFCVYYLLFFMSLLFFLFFFIPFEFV